jgi:hypothetical protein
MRLRSALLAACLLTAPAIVVAASAPRLAPWGITLTDMSPGVKPGDDFYRYVNGAWMDRTTIADDRTTAGVDVVLSDEAERQVRDIAVAEGAKPTSPSGKQIGDLYASYMDAAAIEQAGTAPLKPYLARIAGRLTRLGSPGCSRRRLLPARCAWGSAAIPPTLRSMRSLSARAGWACRRATITCCPAPSTTRFVPPIRSMSRRS